MKDYRCLLFGLLLLLGKMAHAEGGCPPGMIPASGTDINSCVPIPPGYYNNQQQAQPQPPPPPPQWTSQWGAIATDGPGGHLGVATNLSSKDDAEQVAITDCQAKGGVPCAIEVAYDNECAAMVVGHTEHSSNAAASLDEAIHLGMLTCNNAGDTNCHVYYSACSLPVRIQ
ncbi:DUF4189 domain-containing protein [Rhodanobacter sp. C01]|uniref:DUF4189 domain-containing protein n=1 Tax=Rhodanobacter sp. C01 TaxID=1945856 RepID=UPI0009841F04|nr:DUF4189 domain-containing protein [Rhodanobacter sp. C01]OOG47804.1 hypothetical protein B0E50_10135 [Rhodanobacter sp. C01]